MPHSPNRLPLKQPAPLKRPPLVPSYRLRKHPPPVGAALRTPLRLPLLHALLSFIFIALLPQHPLSIPTALGAAFLVVFYLQFFAFRAGYHFRTEDEDQPPRKEPR
jgi:hypothetical protein